MPAENPTDLPSGNVGKTGPAKPVKASTSTTAPAKASSTKASSRQAAAKIIEQVAHQYGIPPAVALAMAEQESGLNANSVGDHGTSFGVYQLHEGGELGSHSEAWADNVRNNAETALRVVAAQRASHPNLDWGTITAMAQRPADQAGYASDINAKLAAYHSSNVTDPAAFFRSHAGAVDGIATDTGGSGNDGGVGNETLSKSDVKAGLDSMGYASALVNSNHSLKSAFNDIVSKQIDVGTSAGQARATQIIENTDWYKNHSAAQRQYQDLKFSDPTTFKAQLADQEKTVASQAKQMGLTVDPDELDKIAKISLRNGLTSADVSTIVQNHLAQQFTYDPTAATAGTAGSTTQQIQQLASEYYAPITNSQIQKYTRQVLAGKLDPTSLSNVFQQQALSMYPYLKSQLDAGQTVADVANPYQQLMANTLELNPDAIKQNDPTIMSALQTKGSDGAMGLMSLSQFQQSLYNDPRWLNTANAKQSLVSTTGQILQKMGLIT